MKLNIFKYEMIIKNLKYIRHTIKPSTSIQLLQQLLVSANNLVKICQKLNFQVCKPAITMC